MKKKFKIFLSMLVLAICISFFFHNEKAYAYSDCKYLTPIPGDILVTSSTSANGLVGHAGIALSSTTILHTAGKGSKAEVISLDTWVKYYPATKLVRYQGSTNTMIKAVNWAKSYYVNGAGKNTPYAITANPRDLTYTYCSEIVWQAYSYGGKLDYKTWRIGTQGTTLAWSIPRIIEPYSYIEARSQSYIYNGFKTIQTINW